MTHKRGVHHGGDSAGRTCPPVVELPRLASSETDSPVERGDAGDERKPTFGTDVTGLHTDRQHDALESTSRRDAFEENSWCHSRSPNLTAHKVELSEHPASHNARW